MNPAFSAGQLRSFLPLFRRSAKKVSLLSQAMCDDIPVGLVDLTYLQLCRLLERDITTTDSEASDKQDNADGKVVKVNTWLARTTLDVIGEGE